ncbi:MAG: glycosyltransferase family 2 protein [Chloroflexota bacterium]
MISAEAPGTARKRATVSVVVPVYYNEHSLLELAGELGSVEIDLQALDMDLELIFVDDGSGDASLARLLEIKQARPATKVVKLTRNFGSVQASKTGFRFVTGDCFLILAADLQDPPQLIFEAARRWRAGAKYVVCVRGSRSDSVGARLFAAIYYRLVRWLAVPNYPPGGYDLALMDREMLPSMRDSAKNINTPIFAYWLGFKPETIEYTRRARRHGRSRWSFRRRLTFFLDSILGFSIVPIRVISLLGLVTAVVSVAYGILVTFSALTGNRPVPGFATLAAMFTFLISLVLLTLGVIAEYVWRIYDEVSRKPEAVIDEVY